MAKKSVSMPDDVEARLEKLKTYFGINSVSGIATVGIELLYWVMEQYEQDFYVKSEKEVGNKVIIREIPIRKPYNNFD